MSYVNARNGNSNRAVTAGVVAVIQTGVILALVNGFGVTIFPPKPKIDRPMVDFTQPVPPPPEPSPQPSASPTVEPSFTARPVPQPLPTRDPVIVPADPFPIPVPTGPIGGFGNGPTQLLPSEAPSPRPAFAPKAAKPKNNPATWVTTSDYPSRDLREGNQGRVAFELAIDKQGRVSACRVTASSGFPGLDAATCKYVSQRARFEPATDETGARVAGQYSGTLRWVIPLD